MRQVAFETYVSVLDTQVILSLDKKPILTEKRIMPPTEAPKKLLLPLATPAIWTHCKISNDSFFRTFHYADRSSACCGKQEFK